MRGPAGGQDPERARGLAAHDHALLPVVVELSALEAQAGVVARETSVAPRVSERPGSPLLVGDQQHRQLREGLGAAGQGARDAERHDVSALHVDGAGAVEAIAVTTQRLMPVVADDGVDVAQQHQLACAGPGHRADQIGRVVGRRARGAVDGGAGRKQPDAHRQGPLGPIDVARRRGDVHQLAQLLGGRGGQLVRLGGDQRIIGDVHAVTAGTSSADRDPGARRLPPKMTNRIG
jgi:hypothetical protein